MNAAFGIRGIRAFNLGLQTCGKFPLADQAYVTRPAILVTHVTGPIALCHMPECIETYHLDEKQDAVLGQRCRLKSQAQHLPHQILAEGQPTPTL